MKRIPISWPSRRVAGLRYVSVGTGNRGLVKRFPWEILKVPVSVSRVYMKSMSERSRVGDVTFFQPLMLSGLPSNWLSFRSVDICPGGVINQAESPYRYHFPKRSCQYGELWSHLVYVTDLSHGDSTPRDMSLEETKSTTKVKPRV